GLETEEELRELKVIRKLSEITPLDIQATFLGAHSVPREYKENPDKFVRIVIEEMLPRVREENLARFVDVFCEEGAFTLEQTRTILEKARELGFELKIHSEEFTNQGSAILGGNLGAASVDHLLKISDSDIEKLSKTSTVLTLMPGTLFFLNYEEFAPARKIIDGGAIISLATDYNAGSCVSASMQMAMSLACIKMKMTPGEAINAATYNASFAIRRNCQVGSLEKGKQADIIVMDVDDYRLIPYHFGENQVKTVIKKGKVIIDL
ncbi:MAG: imidazolonepropionase, partial [Vulcanimicrobiota bacterium]